MPTYQYRCTECGRDLEVVQKFSDAALTECPACQGTLRKVFNAVGVVFKGSGFYRTDSRAGANGSDSGSGSEAGDKPGEKKKADSDNGTHEKTDGKKSDGKKPDASGPKVKEVAAASSGSSSSSTGSSSAD